MPTFILQNPRGLGGIPRWNGLDTISVQLRFEVSEGSLLRFPGHAMMEVIVPPEYSAANYIGDLRAIRATGSVTAETSYYPPMDRLRRIAAILLMRPELDASYRAIAATAESLPPGSH